MADRTVSFGTVGCRLNQYETDQMKRSFAERGYTVVPFDSPADVCVINTCTVTGRSDYRSRQLVRRARRQNRDAVVLVTGCYAQNHPEAVAAIPAVDVVVGNACKLRAADFVERRNGRARMVVDPLPDSFEEGPELREHLGGRTRAFLKIQDGCDQACAYCAVRRARGPARSRDWASIQREAVQALAAGYREIVLTGVNLGSYGRDLDGRPALARVTARLASMSGVGRIRLSSVEPQEVTDDLIELVGSHPRVCRHLHLPLQSGSDRVLRRMKRTYGASDVEALVERIARRIPDCGLGADVMVAFPGEADEDFRATEDLLSRLPVTYLHVFSYSPRPGTPASELPGRVPGEVSKARSLAIRALGRRKAEEFRARTVGRRLQVLFETKDRRGDLTGLSDNYVRVVVRGPDHGINSIAEVEITGVDSEGVSGVLAHAARAGA